MNWLALSPLQVAALWSAGAALALWLYLHNRKPVWRRVSTLRFWASVQPVAQPRRRQLREPLALLAQLAFLLLLIIALANPRVGATTEGRGVVLVLDTSIWSQVQIPGQPPWIEQIRTEAQRVLDALPEDDPVLLMSAQADAAPILQSTTDRAALRQAIRGAAATSSVPDVPRALETGRAALTNSERGLLVYVGPGLLDEHQTQKLDEFRQSIASAANPPGDLQFLVHIVGGTEPVQNRGITRLSLRRDPRQADLWHLLTQVKNYAPTATNATLKLSVNGQSLGQRAIPLKANELTSAAGEFVWEKGGVLQAEISPADVLASDDRASISLPVFRPVQVALIATDSRIANDLFSVIASNPYLQIELVRPGERVQGMPDVGVYQSASPPSGQPFNSIWFAKGSGASGSGFVRVKNWNSQHPVTRWVRTQDISVRRPASFPALPGDVVLAWAETDPPAPVIVAREQNGHRMVMVGFDPDDSNFSFQSGFPLLIAGSIEWMTRPVEEVADSYSVGNVSLSGPATRIVGPSGQELPFARTRSGLSLIATEAGTYRVFASEGSGESVVPVNTPLLPGKRMAATSVERAAIAPEVARRRAWDAWRWLVLIAVVALWLEWWLYYSSRKKRQLAESQEMAERPADRHLQHRADTARVGAGDTNFVTRAGT